MNNKNNPINAFMNVNIMRYLMSDKCKIQNSSWFRRYFKVEIYILQFEDSVFSSTV